MEIEYGASQAQPDLRSWHEIRACDASASNDPRAVEDAMRDGRNERGERDIAGRRF